MLTYEIEEIVNLPSGVISYAIFFNNEHETDCYTMLEAYTYMANHFHDCVMAELRSRSVPHETD